MYLLQAQQSTKLTELAQRLAEWEDKIIPRLEEEVSTTHTTQYSQSKNNNAIRYSQQF